MRVMTSKYGDMCICENLKKRREHGAAAAMKNMLGAGAGGGEWDLELVLHFLHAGQLLPLPFQLLLTRLQARLQLLHHVPHCLLAHVLHLPPLLNQVCTIAAYRTVNGMLDSVYSNLACMELTA